MKTNNDSQLPEVDRRAIGKSKRDRLLDRIEEHRRHIAYYKRWWLPSLAGGLGGLFFFAVLTMLGMKVPGLLLILSLLCIGNGFYWLYKYLAEGKKMEKLQAIAEKHNISRANS